jgi:hypothetical protein
MVNEIINNGILANLTLFGKYDVPAWTLIQYCRHIINNSIKFTTIFNVYKLILSGESINNFAIEKYSKELYPIIGDYELSKKIFNEKYFQKNEYLEKNIVRLEREDTQKIFWNLIRNQERPSVLIKDGNGWLPIYQQENRTSIIIKNISVNSPPSISLEGLGETINDLRFGSDREIQMQIECTNKNILDATNNVTEILKSSKLLNDPLIPEGIKAYGNSIYQSLLEKQSILNEKIGIYKAKINILA